ncbi:MAG: amino acid racemase [Candidatus Aenigmarchaeota archaeon]|nr:amino acid racemase [Candidatus Aenigmarchaeota archaeon]
MRTVGVLGGFGPEATSEFYVSIVNKNRALNKIAHPSILIYNVPNLFRLEEAAVKTDGNLGEFLPLLLSGIKILEEKSDFIVMPCNTLHIFIEDIRKASRVPVLSILDETVGRIKKMGIRKIGILATMKTIKEKLFEEKLEENGIETIKPDISEQKRVSEIIHCILKGEKTEEMKTELLGIVTGLKEKGAEAVILGCTDLQLLINQENSGVKLIDTVDVLADSAVRILNEGG